MRRWIESDYDPFIELNRDTDVMKFFPKPLTPEETLHMIKRIGLAFEQNGYGLFAVEKRSTQEFIGFAGFARPSFESYFTPCVEIGWRFKKEAWGNGYATEAAIACLNYGFQTLHFDRILSFTSLLNGRSEKVMQRIGLTKIGEFDHPNIDPAHALCRHVVYGLEG
ncbi:MAG TPA: GNAT family N-acetyltransferase [Puia sp.]